MPTYWEDFDVNDPPQFEGQAAYLRRLGLLLPNKKPPRAAFAPQAIDVDGEIAMRRAAEEEFQRRQEFLAEACKRDRKPTRRIDR